MFENLSPNLVSFYPIIALFLVALVIACGGAFIGVFIGPRKYLASKVSPYECGVPHVDAPTERISIKYYLVAILFLLFDLEVAFLLPVAIAWGDLKLQGPMTLSLMGFFLFIFCLTLWYEFKVKALEWER